MIVDYFDSWLKKLGISVTQFAEYRVMLSGIETLEDFEENLW
jgi:hypothetical protein